MHFQCTYEKEYNAQWLHSDIKVKIECILSYNTLQAKRLMCDSPEAVRVEIISIDNIDNRDNIMKD